MLKRFLCIVCISFLFMQGNRLEADGFANFELSARAASLGGAFVARADDITALYYNPAGLVDLRGFRFKANILYNNLTTNAYNAETGIDYKSNPLQIRGSYYLNLNLGGRISLGVGIFNPYFSHVDWPWNWPGRLLSDTARMNSYYIRPVIAVKVLQGLNIGLGLDFVTAKMNWSHAQPVVWGGWHTFLDSRIETEGNGTGLTAGILLRPFEKLRIGVKYQHKIRIDLEGKNILYYFHSLDFQHFPSPYNHPDAVIIPAGEFGRNYQATSRMTLPTEVLVGAYYRPVSKVSLQLDFQWNEWSQFRGWRFESSKPSCHFIQDAGYEWKDVWKVKFGFEYFINQYFALRSGYSFHQSAVLEEGVHPNNPDFDQNILSVGFGYEGPFFSIWDYEKSGELSFDVFFQYIMSDMQVLNQPEYALSVDADRWLVGVGFGLNF